MSWKVVELIFHKSWEAMAFNTAGKIHYLAITCYFVHNYVTVVLKNNK